MQRLASSTLLNVMYALPVGPFLAATDPYGPDLLTEICSKRSLTTLFAVLIQPHDYQLNNLHVP